jgi:hypothetical protein
MLLSSVSNKKNIRDNRYCIMAIRCTPLHVSTVEVGYKVMKETEYVVS